MKKNFVIKPISKAEWKEVNRRECGNKVIVTVQVGNIIKDNGTSPMTVDMYDYIWDGIAGDARYNISFDASNTPLVSITYNGSLVIYNDMMESYIREVKEAIQQIDVKTVYAALAQFRVNAECLEKLGEDAKRLISRIREITEADYSNGFIYDVLVEWIEEKNFKVSNRAVEAVRYMEYEDLLKALVGIIEVKTTSDYTFDPVDTLLRLGYNSDQLEYYIYKEIAYRLLRGEIAHL